MTLCKRVLSGLAQFQDQPALVSEGKKWRGDWILNRVYSLVAELKTKGVRAGTTVCWHGEEQPEVMLVRLAALLLNARFESVFLSEGEPGALMLTAADLLQLEEVSSGAVDMDTVKPYAQFEVVRNGLNWSATSFCDSVVTVADIFSRPGARVVILTPLSALGGDVVLSGWCINQVAYWSQFDRPAQTFAFLERIRPDYVVMSAALLRHLMIHPAIRLTDFGALKHIIYDADESGVLSAEELERGQAAFGAEITGVVATASGLVAVKDSLNKIRQDIDQVIAQLMVHPMVESAEARFKEGAWIVSVVPAKRYFEKDEDATEAAVLLSEMTLEMNRQFSHVNLDEAVAAMQRLRKTALLSMLNAFYRSGLFADKAALHTEEAVLEAACVAQRHRALIRRWIKVLVEEGLLHWKNHLLCAVPEAACYSTAALEQAWNEVERAWTATVGSVCTIDYARRNAMNLPAVMSDAMQAVHLLFPEGKIDLARTLYQESIVARYQNNAVSAVLSRILKTCRKQRPIRILEVGAGTGATSETILPALGGFDIDYLFTDVSKYFLDQATVRLAEYPCVRFALYDIDVDPEAQGFSSNAFDIVIGGGVLNAAKNTDASVRWLTRLLCPGGWMVLTEPTVEEYWVMASQAFMLADASDDRAESSATFLSLPQWNSVLDEAGLLRVLGLPEEGHPLERLGHRVFVARAKMDRVALDVHELSGMLADGRETVQIEIADAPSRLEGAPDQERQQNLAADERFSEKALLV